MAWINIKAIDGTTVSVNTRTIEMVEEFYNDGRHERTQLSFVSNTILETEERRDQLMNRIKKVERAVVPEE